jgi:hypothetical protein
MHWCWRIVKEGFDPRSVPSMVGVPIRWAHLDSSGMHSQSHSMAGATAMVNAYGIQGLGVPPALNTRHGLGLAVDMAIHWSGTLPIVDGTGASVSIASAPRTGMNAQLKIVGATYGVIKFVGGAADRPHWSDNGH